MGVELLKGTTRQIAMVSSGFSKEIINRYQSKNHSLYKGISLVFLKPAESQNIEEIHNHPVYVTMRLLLQKIYMENHTTMLMNHNILKKSIDVRLSQLLEQVRNESYGLYQNLLYVINQVSHCESKVEKEKMEQILLLQMERMQGSTHVLLNEKQKELLQQLEKQNERITITDQITKEKESYHSQQSDSVNNVLRPEIPKLLNRFMKQIGFWEVTQKNYSEEEKLMTFMNLLQEGSIEERNELTQFLFQKQDLVYNDSLLSKSEMITMFEKKPEQIIGVLEQFYEREFGHLKVEYLDTINNMVANYHQDISKNTDNINHKYENSFHNKEVKGNVTKNHYQMDNKLVFLQKYTEKVQEDAVSMAGMVEFSLDDVAKMHKNRILEILKESEENVQKEIYQILVECKLISMEEGKLVLEKTSATEKKETLVRLVEEMKESRFLRWNDVFLELFSKHQEQIIKLNQKRIEEENKEISLEQAEVTSVQSFEEIMNRLNTKLQHALITDRLMEREQTDIRYQKQLMIDTVCQMEKDQYQELYHMLQEKHLVFRKNVEIEENESNRNEVIDKSELSRHEMIHWIEGLHKDIWSHMVGYILENSFEWKNRNLMNYQNSIDEQTEVFTQEIDTKVFNNIEVLRHYLQDKKTVSKENTVLTSMDVLHNIYNEKRTSEQVQQGLLSWVKQQPFVLQKRFYEELLQSINIQFYHQYDNQEERMIDILKRMEQEVQSYYQKNYQEERNTDISKRIEQEVQLYHQNNHQEERNTDISKRIEQEVQLYHQNNYQEEQNIDILKKIEQEIKKMSSESLIKVKEELSEEVATSELQTLSKMIQSKYLDVNQMKVLGERISVIGTSEEMLERPGIAATYKKKLIHILKNSTKQEAKLVTEYLHRNKILQRSIWMQDESKIISSVQETVFHLNYDQLMDLVHYLKSNTNMWNEDIQEQIKEENLFRELSYKTEKNISDLSEHVVLTLKQKEENTQIREQVEQVIENYKVIEQTETRNLMKQQNQTNEFIETQAEEIDDLKRLLNEQIAMVEELKVQVNNPSINTEKIYREMMDRMEHQLRIERQRRGMD